MARYSYDRLTAQDAGFLWAETPNQPMHVGALAVLDAAPVKNAEGGIDIDLYRKQIDSVLHWIPRYRQKIDWTPLEGWPIWVDDRQFDLGYHIRHIALPQPGTTAVLKELAARINSRRLDRRYPLWEIWVIEGLAGGEQFALLNKIHHCMIDGAAGADLSQILMSPSPRVEPGDPVPYMPRPVPTRGELMRDEVALGLGRPLSLLQDWVSKGAALVQGAALGEAGKEPPKASESKPTEEGRPSLDRKLRSMKHLIDYAVARPSSTPLNGELGPHRRVEWLTMPLEDVKDLRRVLGCTINDVVLTTVTEAVRRYLFRRRVDHRSIDFRVSAPVSVRRAEHDRRQGNHVSSWVVPLPLDCDEPLDQLDAIKAQTQALKQSDAALAIETVMEWAEYLPGPLLSRGLAGIGSSGPVNMIVTNVPGPQFPLYMVGARLLAMYPFVPLIPGGGLGVALFSYEGKLCWGFNGDYELIPDLSSFVDDVRIAFERLRSAGVSRFMERRTSQEDEVQPREESEAVATETPKKARKPRKSGKSEKAKAATKVTSTPMTQTPSPAKTKPHEPEPAEPHISETVSIESAPEQIAESA